MQLTTRNIVFALAMAACAAEPADPTADAVAVIDAAPAADAAPPDAAPPDAAPPDADAAPPDAVDADDYCEHAVEVFCPYYLRCARMAVADAAACRALFLETCNARYEPLYAAHAAAGELTLSRAGLAACAAHLATVDCDAHDFDLDGPCRAVWQGQVGPGGVCGPGIGTFVCAPATTCRIDLATFCGTCEPSAVIDAPCGDDARCGDDGECRAGVCVARPTAGQPCAPDGPRCVTGTSCQADRCALRPWAAPGEACGQAARCQYGSACVGGRCVAGAPLDAACDASTPCANGWCDAGVCAPAGAADASCATGAACLGGVCDGERCGDPRGGCWTP